MAKRLRIDDPYLGFFARIKCAETGSIIGGVRCLEWTGKLNEHGYGNHYLRGRCILAHRYAWQSFKSPIPEGMNVCHKCDNPRCCEIAHLFVGTQADNLVDMTNKGRRVVSPPIGEHHGMAKLNASKVASIRQRHAGGTPQAQLATEYGVSSGLISQIVTRTIWKHVA